MADETSSTSPDAELTLQPTSVVTVPRRRALWGVLAAVAVAAGALAITAGGGDGSPPVLPVALGAAGRDSAAGEAAPATADMRMAWITYVAGEGLPPLGGEGPVFRLTGAVDDSSVRGLASALGMTGDPTHEDGYWHVQTGDAVLEVYDDGGGSWWYSVNALAVADSGSASGGGSAGCEGGPAVDCGPVDGSGVVDPATTLPADECAKAGAACATTTVIAECGPNAECADPGIPCSADPPACVVPPPIEPPVATDLPSQGEARQIALDLLSATGVDVAGAKVTVDGPYDAWYVTVEPVLDGLPVSGWASSVAVGSEGAITNASGTLARPDRVGDYELIDTRAAIDRLNEQQQYYGGGVMRLGGPGTASSTGVATADAPSTATPCAPDDATCLQIVDPPATASVTSEGCSTQPDGTEVCSSSGVGIACPDIAVAPMPDGAAETTLATPCPEPAPYPEPEPMEVTLTDAERVLVLMASFDGSGDAYLLPGYRFSGDDGTIAEVAAVADESLAPTTTVPATDTTVAPVQPGGPDLTYLPDGEQPEIGVSYYVDGLNTHCGTFVFAGRWWATDAQTPLPWSTPTEGGTFTLTTADEGTFVGDYAGTKTATFTARGPAEELPACA